MGAPQAAAGSAGLWRFWPEPRSPGFPRRALGGPIYALFNFMKGQNNARVQLLFQMLRSSRHPTVLSEQFTKVIHIYTVSWAPWIQTPETSGIMTFKMWVIKTSPCVRLALVWPVLLFLSNERICTESLSALCCHLLTQSVQSPGPVTA